MMAWFKVDDKFHSHPKVISVPLAATGLWVLAGAWSADQLTDGFVPKTALRLFGATATQAKELVRAGLWIEAEGGWLFHDWLDHQPSRVEVEGVRQRERERKAEWRARTRNSKTTGKFERRNGDDE